MGIGLGPVFQHHPDMTTSPGYIQRYAHHKRWPLAPHRNQGPDV